MESPMQAKFEQVHPKSKGLYSQLKNPGCRLVQERAANAAYVPARLLCLAGGEEMVGVVLEACQIDFHRHFHISSIQRTKKYNIAIC